MTFFIGTFIRPGKTFTRLGEDNKNIIYAWIVLIVLEVCFIFSAIMYVVADLYPWAPIFVKLPLKEYFVYQIFFSLPWSFACLLMAIGMIMSLSRIKGGDLSYYRVFTVVTFAVCVPLFILWFFDIVLIFLIIFKVIDRMALIEMLGRPLGGLFIFVITYCLATIVGNFILIPLAVVKLNILKKGPAIALGICTTIMFWGALALLIR